jgi:uncharacterized membrane protein
MLHRELLLISMLAAVGAEASPALESTFTPIEAPGAIFTEALGINNRDQIVGMEVDAGNIRHGFLLEHGVFTRIDVPGASGTSANGINDLGQIVGWYVVGLHAHGFIWDQGVFSFFDPPDASDTFLTDINNHGQIVGWYIPPTGPVRGILLEDGVFMPFGVPNACCILPDTSSSLGINDNGQIAGSYYDRGLGIHGFLLQHGLFASIDFSGAAATTASGINNLRQIVGRYNDAPGVAIGGYILAPDGSFTTIETIPIGINDRGDVVGWYVSGDRTHGFLMTPSHISIPTFAGAPGTANCHGQSVSVLAREFKGLPAAASALGFPNVQALQQAIRRFCDR